MAAMLRPNPGSKSKLFQDKVDWLILSIDIVVLVTLVILMWQGWLRFDLPFYLGL